MQARVDERPYLFYSSAVLLFILSFLTPVVLLFNVGKIFTNGGANSVSTEGEDLFATALTIPGTGGTLEIDNSPALEPKEKEDFLLIAWFNLRELPAQGAREVFLAKSEDEGQAKHGYALGITHDGGGLRPMVLWMDAEGKGGWYVFSEMNLVPRTWFMLAVSLQKGRYLGLHSATHLGNQKPQIILQGGYDLNGEVWPKTSADLRVGAHAPNPMRGRIGPVGIFSKKGLTEELRPVLKDLVSKPSSLPESLSGEDIKLWVADGQKDSSGLGHNVQFVQGGRGKKNRGS